MPYFRPRFSWLCLPWVVLLGLAYPAAASEKLAERLAAVMEAPTFKHAHWGVLAADLATGETLYELNADRLFAPASTTKLFSVAAALDALGAEHRFETPVYARGEIDAEGRLLGDLVLAASGDLCMGGRTDCEGRIAFTNNDHTYAEFNSTAILTSPDPLAGLNDLASQIAVAIRHVKGDVLIDDRLFDAASGTGSGPSLVTPILVNDNVIDVIVSPAAEGEPAAVDWRPRTASWQVDAQVQTSAPGTEMQVEVTSPQPGWIAVRGSIPAGRAPLVRILPVADPGEFARVLLIEALARHGVAVDAPLAAENSRDRLPDPTDYQTLRRVAVHQSLPFRENARLILKVSHNLHASTLPLLLAAREGDRTLADGLRRQREFLLAAGIDADSISLGGAAGGDRADYVTPRATLQLLRHMAQRPDFAAYLDALPVMGQDGTLATAVASDSPAFGRVQAKTGTLIWRNAMNGRFLLQSKALAGYLTTTSERRLAFGLWVNNVHLESSADTVLIGRELGRMCEILCEEL